MIGQRIRACCDHIRRQIERDEGKSVRKHKGVVGSCSIACYRQAVGADEEGAAAIVARGKASSNVAESAGEKTLESFLRRRVAVTKLVGRAQIFAVVAEERPSGRALEKRQISRRV